MSYETQVPIREELISRVVPLIDKHKGSITVLGYDIQLQSFMQQGSNGTVLVNTWCLIITALGALVGPSNYLSYTYTFGTDPQVPDDRSLEAYVKETMQRIGIMQVRQLQVGRGTDSAN